MTTSKKPKVAVTYLRVSTKDQARRDGNPEGYSLPTQRAAAETEASKRNAYIAAEYLAERVGFEPTT